MSATCLSTSLSCVYIFCYWQINVELSWELYAIRLGRIFALLPVQFVRTPRTGVRLLQEREENESGQLHSDGPRWDAAQGSGRKRSSFQPDRLLRFAAQGSSRCRPLEHRLSPEKDPTPSGRSLRGSSINYRRISVDRPKPKLFNNYSHSFREASRASMWAENECI